MSGSNLDGPRGWPVWLPVLLAPGLLWCGLSAVAVAPGFAQGQDCHAERRQVPIRSGFPVDFTESPFGSEVRGQLSAVDLDGNGKKDILFGANDGMIHLFRDDGSEVRDGLWPRHTGGPIVGTVRAGDLEGDGSVQVVAASYDGKVYAFTDRGDRLWTADTHQPGLTASPILTGKPGTDERRVVFTTPDGALEAVSAHGSQGWIFQGGVSAGSPPAEVDLQGTGESQILMRNDAGTFQLLDEQGQPVRSWPPVSYAETHGPAGFVVADLTGDGTQQIVAEQREGLAPSAVAHADGACGKVPRPGEEGVVAWTASGEAANGFSVDGEAPSSIRVGDIAGDGRKWLTFADRQGRIHVTAPDGTERPGWPLEITDLYKQVHDRRLEVRGSPDVEKAPVIADVDGDGSPDLVFLVNDPRQPDELSGMVFAVSSTGKPIPGFPKFVGRSHGQMLLADLDDGGSLELVVAAGLGGTGRQLHVFELPTSQKVEMFLLGSEFKQLRGE